MEGAWTSVVKVARFSETSVPYDDIHGVTTVLPAPSIGTTVIPRTVSATVQCSELFQVI